MVRGITKETEALIAIVIFILFIIFYFKTFTVGIVNRLQFYQQIYSKSSTADSIFNSLLRNGYIIYLNVSIPLYTKEFACTSSILKNDFCEKFPVFYPLNLSFLTNDSGILNNTDDTLLDPKLGIFFYVNLSKFSCEKDKGYVIVRIENPYNMSFSNIYVFITSPTIYKWLEDYNYIKINGSYTYCYLNYDGKCNNYINGSKGIVIRIQNIKPGSTIYLNISKSSSNYADNIGTVDLTPLPYKIIYEPICYKEYDFIIAKNLTYHLKKYWATFCSIYSMNNTLLNFVPLYRKLVYRLGINNYTYFYEMYLLSREIYDKLYDKNISCLIKYTSPSGNVYYSMFNGSRWFIEILSDNTNTSVNLISWGSYGEVNFIQYYNYTGFYVFPNNGNFRYNVHYNILFRGINNNIFGFIFLEEPAIIRYYNITSINNGFSYTQITYLMRFNISLTKEVNRTKTYLYFYLLSLPSTYDNLLRNAYYEFKLPRIRISKIVKIAYIDIRDLFNSSTVAFRINELNITYGILEDKGFSKTYPTYILANNSLLKANITIYIK